VLGSIGRRRLKPGDVVEVRPAAEILATLDVDASVDAMPFMPEMLRYAGKRFTVSRRVEKICDTVSGQYSGGPLTSLRMRDTVLLDDLRCDGSAHGGCQAGCRFYWKESWLRRAEPGSESESVNGDALAQLEALARDATRAVRDVDGEPAEAYRCQATEALNATEPMSNYSPGQYVRELTAGNVGPLRFLRVAVRGLSAPIRRRLRLLARRPLPFDPAPPPGPPELDLQPGELVEVRSREEIAPTIDASGKTRGLSFDWEMLPYCGGRYRVRDRVERIIDERNGQMIEISSDCLILDGVVCSGEHSSGRWFCPRAMYPYWREAWLRRPGNAESSSPDGSNGPTGSPEAG
jgi:hypothetical protein